MNIKTIGMDLAKNEFQLHGAAIKGKTVLKKQLKRAQVLPFFGRAGESITRVKFQ